MKKFFSCYNYNIVCYVFVLLVVVTCLAQEEEDEPPCKDGYCPMPSSSSSRTTTGGRNDDKDKCGLWLGPSPIKQKEEHGFGLGMFTGRAIAKGEAVEHLYTSGKGLGEVLLPLYGPTNMGEWPPLREYIWDSSELPEVDMQGGDFTSFAFVPGLSAIAPCTNQNYNLVWSGNGKALQPTYATHQNAVGVHRAKDATAGSFTYWNNVTYVATRDIVEGEELTVECTDDSYDGGAYYLSRYEPDIAEKESLCLDRNVEARATSSNTGNGLFAKRVIKKKDVVVSSPLLPIHRSELEIKISNEGEGGIEMLHQQQIMLNYAYGHPRSNLLLLPFGPLVSYMNNGGKKANVRINWHKPFSSDTKQGRAEYHHTELFDKSGDKVAYTHGKGLMMDYVALRDIEKDEELLIDYGKDWSDAYERHQKNYAMYLQEEDEASYLSATEYVKLQGDEILKTVEDKDPYPENLHTECFYHSLKKKKKKKGDIVVISWDKHSQHTCFLPCRIIDRYTSYEDDNYEDNTNNPHIPQKRHRYTVEFDARDNYLEIKKCQLPSDVQKLLLSNVPRDAIRLVDKPFSTDMFLDAAFRHEIGVPTGFYPEKWITTTRKKKLRGEKNKNDEEDDDFHGNNDTYKRKRKSEKEEEQEYISKMKE